MISSNKWTIEFCGVSLVPSNNKRTIEFCGVSLVKKKWTIEFCGVSLVKKNGPYHAPRHQIFAQVRKYFIYI